MDERELALRREIMTAFAAGGEPPDLRSEDEAAARALAAAHVVVLDERPDGPPRIHMAHPFAAHREGTRVEAEGRTWWGSCAWDGLGIVAALGLRDARVESNGIALAVRDGELDGDALFHVLVPARRWWDDVGYT